MEQQSGARGETTPTPNDVGARRGPGEVEGEAEKGKAGRKERG
jgi:hypothetical protein